MHFRPFILAGLFATIAAAPWLAQASDQPPGWSHDMRLPESPDRNPDPRIVEINLAAQVANVPVGDGRTVQAWTYNGGLPGPLIRVQVGQRLIVHFTNSLPDPTTVHWHGLRVPIQMDGVPGHSQPEVPPGGTFTSDFVVPDAGFYWYHPHVMSAAQVGFGLYGPLLVEDPEDQVGTEDELLLVLSDIALDDQNKLEPPDSGGSTGMAFGREGNVVLVNGRPASTLTVRSGARQRWRIVNAAKSRYFLLDMDDQPFVQIGGDGGLNEHSTETTKLLLATGERADVLVTPKGVPGKDIIVRSFLHNRGYGSIEYRTDSELFTIKFADMPPIDAGPAPDVRREIQPVARAGATEVKLDFTIKQDRDGVFEYGVNGVPHWTAKPLLAKPGETQIWTLNNTTPWSHPFHLHGFFFQVLDAKGEPVRPLAWKDTVNVPFKESVRVIVRFDEDRPGTWMFHCHILDHADGGLMGTVQVGESSTIALPHKH